MYLHVEQQLQQSQKLIMTPALRQAIEVLQYNAAELSEHVALALLDNPTLEEYTANEPSGNEVLDSVDWRQLVSDNRSQPSLAYGRRDDDYNYENFVASVETLHDHLHRQLHFVRLSSVERAMAKVLINHIDNNGYLAIDEDEFFKNGAITREQLKPLIALLQGFDPPGVAASTLSECLTIQLNYHYGEQPIAKRIVEAHIDDLAKGRIRHLAKQLGESCQAVQAACDLIKSLNPKPGQTFGNSNGVRYLQPEVDVRVIDGDYVVTLNHDIAPRLRVSAYYQRLLRLESVDHATSDYIADKLKAALQLIKSIEQRRTTVKRVVEAIVDVQRDFFNSGALQLKSLNLSDIAQRVGVHESTVSRAINGKYLQCQHGIFPLKYFFPSGVTDQSGSQVSAEMIKSVIRELVAKEDAQKPLSDQKIVWHLQQIGIDVSRRTIAKYRDTLGIASSSKRKRF